ncbi:N-acetylneuraminate synthase family protein, partial [Pseudomonas aeruginosa]|uniref:N-acetylneuraminate synthase family protein n=1 Tax=Pseudomonas aeruginosa TaxID=287 RepID=UPI0031B6B2B7
ESVTTYLGRVPIAAVARGACIIEKHFTLDRSMPGPDHKASLEPGELAQMVAQIRMLEVALGSPYKAPQPSEWDTRQAARQQVVAARDIEAGM